MRNLYLILPLVFSIWTASCGPTNTMLLKDTQTGKLLVEHSTKADFEVTRIPPEKVTVSRELLVKIIADLNSMKELSDDPATKLQIQLVLEFAKEGFVVEIYSDAYAKIGTQWYHGYGETVSRLATGP